MKITADPKKLYIIYNKIIEGIKESNPKLYDDIGQLLNKNEFDFKVLDLLFKYIEDNFYDEAVSAGMPITYARGINTIIGLFDYCGIKSCEDTSKYLKSKHNFQSIYLLKGNPIDIIDDALAYNIYCTLIGSYYDDIFTLHSNELKIKDIAALSSYLIGWGQNLTIDKLYLDAGDISKIYHLPEQLDTLIITDMVIDNNLFLDRIEVSDSEVEIIDLSELKNLKMIGLDQFETLPNLKALILPKESKDNGPMYLDSIKSSSDIRYNIIKTGNYTLKCNSSIINIIKGKLKSAYKEGK